MRLLAKRTEKMRLYPLRTLAIIVGICCLAAMGIFSMIIMDDMVQVKHVILLGQQQM